MAGGNRRSMGTKPTRTSAVRVSMDTRGGLDSAHKGKRTSMNPPAPASGTRIPRPSMRGPFGSGNKKSVHSTAKRSSSTHLSRPSMGTAFMTPRSNSSSRTPQNVLKPLSVNPNRFSMSGVGSSVGKSSRGSFIGAKAVKDSRPLNDKAWQETAIKGILEFLDTHGYPKAMTTGNFPLNSTDFRNIFEFTMNFLIEGFSIEGRRIELELPGLLKKIGYPIAVSKSSFQTLGTNHSWPSVLGVIDYLVTRAQALVVLQENMASIAFPNKDEDGFDLGPDTESDDKIVFDHFVNCYYEFNRGRDTFEPEFAQLETNLYENHGLHSDSLAKLEREKEDCMVKLAEAEVVPNRCEAVVTKLAAIKKDLATYQAYAESSKNYVLKKRREKAELEERNENLDKRLEEIKMQNVELDAACRAKGINPDTTDMSYLTDALTKQVKAQRELNTEQEKINWDLEIKLGKATEEVDSKIRKFNHKLMSLELTEETLGRLSLDLNSRPSEVFMPLQNLIKVKKAEERNLQQLILKMKATLEKEQQNQRLQREELAKTERDTMTLQSEINSSAAAIDAEDDRLTSEIDEVKARLLETKMTSEVGSQGLGGLKAEAESLEARVKEKERFKAIKGEEGLKFLEAALGKAEKALEAKRAQRDKAIEDLKAAYAKEIQNNDELGKAVKEMVKKYQKELE